MFWLALILMIFMTFLFSAASAAFITASQFSFEILKSKGKDAGHIVSAFYERPRIFQISMKMGLVIMQICFGVFVIKIFSEGIDKLSVVGRYEGTFTVLISWWIVLIFGELISKQLGRWFPDHFFHWMVYPVYLLERLLYWPSVLLLRGYSRFEGQKSELTNVSPKVTFTPADLENYLEKEVSIPEEELEANLFKNALQLRQIKISGCMIPRNEIVSVDKRIGLIELTNVFADSKLSRVLVVNGSIDEIIGYIHHQQLFKNPTSVLAMIRDILVVPETMNVYDLLLRMNKQHHSIACVVDEFGGTSGIITMEDILEQIFGEIADEHDKEELVEEIIHPGEYLFAGRLNLEYLRQKYHMEFPVGDYHTLSGYLVDQIGKIPQQGEAINLMGYRFIPELVSNTRIETVRVIQLKD